MRALAIPIIRYFSAYFYMRLSNAEANKRGGNCVLYILDKNLRPLGILSNTAPEALGYWGDEHVENLEGILTYKFITGASHETAQFLTAENYVIVRDLDKKLMLFQIKIPTERHENGTYTKEIYCESAAQDDLRTSFVKPTKLTAVDVKAAATHALQGTSWEVGAYDYAGLTDFDFNDYPSSLEALHQIREAFDAELRFYTQWDGARIVKRLVDIVKQRGSETGKRFEYSKDLLGVIREEDSTELATALIGIGKSDDNGGRLTFTELSGTYEGYAKNAGVDWIGDEEARNKYGREGKHIFAKFEDTTADAASVLLERAAKQLKKVSKPRYTYEVSVLLLERLTGLDHEKVRLGDTILIRDTTFTPTLILSARVLELVRSYTDPSKDSVILGEFAPVYVDNNAAIRELQKKVAQKEGEWAQAAETIHKSTTEPTEKTQDMLWLDLTAVPNILKRWNGSTWVKATATTAAEVGAETPTGAQDKATTAKTEAVAAAAVDATTKANEAQAAAKVHAEAYSERAMHIGTSPPTDTSKLWLDNNNPLLPLLKKYMNNAWVSATTTRFDQLIGQVGTVQIADASIESQKIKDGAVEAIKLKDAAVTKDKIAPNAVTATHIEAGAINEAKMKWNSHLIF